MPAPAPSPTSPLSLTHRFVPGETGWTVLVLHSTGGDEEQLLPLARQLAPGAALLSPRGTVLEGGVTRRFFARDPDGTLNLEDLAEKTDEVAAFVDEAISAYGLDPARIVALGYSNGANVATELLFRRPGLLRGAALLRPVMTHRPDDQLDLTGTAVLIAAGAVDAYASPTAIAALQATFATAGATVEVATEPTGHGLTDGDLQSTQRWLAQTLSAA